MDCPPLPYVCTHFSSLSNFLTLPQFFQNCLTEYPRFTLAHFICFSFQSSTQPSDCLFFILLRTMWSNSMEEILGVTWQWWPITSVYELSETEFPRSRGKRPRNWYFRVFMWDIPTETIKFEVFTAKVKAFYDSWTIGDMATIWN